jgi:hypothetical protein
MRRVWRMGGTERSGHSSFSAFHLTYTIFLVTQTNCLPSSSSTPPRPYRLLPEGFCFPFQYIQGYYKINRQFQHFINPKLFKISTLRMHGFVEKLWKFYHCSPSWRKQREVRNYLETNIPQRCIGRATGNMSLARWPSRSPELTPCDFFMGICQRQGLRPSRSFFLDDLKQRITTAAAGVDEDMLTRNSYPLTNYLHTKKIRTNYINCLGQIGYYC